MNAHVGHGGEPVGELGVQVVEVAERPAEEEVLADVAERPLHLALGLRPVGPAGFRVKAVMAGEVEQRAVVDDAAFRRLADDGGLHPVVEDLRRHAAEVGERRDVAAQDRLQVLMQDEARPQPAARSRAPARTARRSVSPPVRRRRSPETGRSRPAPGGPAASRRVWVTVCPTPPRSGRRGWRDLPTPYFSQGRPGEGRHDQLGNFQSASCGRITPASAGVPHHRAFDQLLWSRWLLSGGL